MKRTRVYNLKTLGTGDFYSERDDRQRMTTIDTHLHEFARTVGNGVCNGWKIEPVAGRDGWIRVTPGVGLIGGLMTESPWKKDPITGEPIRKNQADAEGLEIVSKVTGWSDPNPDSWLGAFYKVGGQPLSKALVFDQLGPEGEDLDTNFGVLAPVYKTPSDQFYDNPYVKALDEDLNYIELFEPGERIDITPVMTSPTTPAPYVVSADTVQYPSTPAWKAFDSGGSNQYWLGYFSVGCWIKIDLGKSFSRSIQAYRIYENYFTGKPSGWKFQGSHNDLDWVDLDVKTNQDTAVAGGVYSVFTNYTPYRYYRFYFTSKPSNSQGIGVHDIKLYATGSTCNADYYIMAERISTDISETFAEFNSSSSNLSGPNKLLLGKVVVRNGTIINVDYSSVRNLSGLSGTISSMAQNYIERHRHNGTRPFDPPAVRLATDIRKARLSVVGSGEWAGFAQYIVYGSKETSSTSDHRHTYQIEQNGEGYTQDIIGEVDFHYHLIQNNKVIYNVQPYNSSLLPHIHEIGNDKDSWTSRSRTVVRVNGEAVPEEAYILYPEQRSIVFKPGYINIKQAVYKTSFPIDDTRVFTLEEPAYSVKNFIKRIMKEFQQYKSEYRQITDDGLYNKEATIRDPFNFWILDGKDVEQGHDSFVISDYVPIHIWPTGPAEALSDGVRANIITVALYKLGGIINPESMDARLIDAEKEGSIRAIDPYLTQQSRIADSRLIEAGDVFTVSPYVARFLPITLVSPAQIDDVEIEILENVEVTGVLNPENILFIQSEKFTTGVFDKDLIPLIGHSGRIRNTVLPESYKTTTTDGYSFTALATKTNIAFEHGHLVSVDKYGNGITIATTVNNQICYSQPVNGVPTIVSHLHTIESGILSDEISAGINLWQNKLPEEAHFHNIIVPICGDSKSIFSILESLTGDIFIGTSNGLLAKPKNGGCRIVINGYEYESLLSNGYYAAKEAFKRHIDLVGEFVSFVDDESALTDYEAITSKTTMACKIDSYGVIFTGQRKNVNGQNFPINISVDIEPKEIVRVDSFYRLAVKTEDQLNPEDQIIYANKIAQFLTSELTLAYGYLYPEIDTSQENFIESLMFLVKESYDSKTIWSLSESDDGSILACSNKNIYKSSPDRLSWNELETPSGVTVFREILKDSTGNVLALTNSGILNYSKDFSYEKCRRLKAINGDLDIIAGLYISPLKILAAIEDGIYYSVDDGLTWASSLPKVEIVKFSKDPTDSQGTIYALSKTGYMYKTVNDGINWEQIEDAPNTFGEYGEFIAAFGTLFFACKDGLVKWSGSEWVMVLPDERVKTLVWTDIGRQLDVSSESSQSSLSSESSLSSPLSSDSSSSDSTESNSSSQSLSSGLGLSTSSSSISSSSESLSSGLGLSDSSDSSQSLSSGLGLSVSSSSISSSSQSLSSGLGLSESSSSSQSSGSSESWPMEICIKEGGVYSGFWGTIDLNGTYIWNGSYYLKDGGLTKARIIYTGGTNKWAFNAGDGTSWGMALYLSQETYEYSPIGLTYLPGTKVGYPIVLSGICSSSSLSSSSFSSSSSSSQPPPARLLVGSDNKLFEITSVNAEPNLVISLLGAPIPRIEINKNTRYFGYSYNNLANSVSFKNRLGTSFDLTVAASFDIWQTTNGGWDQEKHYEVYSGAETVLNTKTGIDKRVELDLIFTVNPTNGVLDFTISTPLTSEILPGRTTIDIANSLNFDIGDTIAIVKFPTSIEKMSPEEVNALTEVDFAILAQAASRGVYAEKRVIVSKTSKSITVDRAFTDNITLPATVKNLSVVNSDLELFVSIYQVNLLNTGVDTHYEIEDKMAYESAGLSYELSNVQSANISELTLALKDAIYYANSKNETPVVDYNYQNWKSYMMRFSADPLNPNSIHNFFDVEQSNINSGVSGQTPFEPKNSSSINVVAPGQKTYSDLMFVGTDLGLFASKREGSDIPINWFAVYTCPAGAIYDILFPGEDKIIVAGENGLWVTKGGTLKTWIRLAEDLVKGPIYFARNRWRNFGSPGNYWWDNWDANGTNLVDPDLSNTIVVGGQNNVMTSSDNGTSWSGSLTPFDSATASNNTSDYQYKASGLLPLKSGKAIMVINDVKKRSDKEFLESKLLVTYGVGDSWLNLRTFYGRAGKISGLTTSEGGNTELTVIYTSGIDIQSNFFVGGYLKVGKDLYKIARHRDKKIIIYGTEALEKLKLNDSFRINPSPIESVVEDSKGHLLLATGQNLLSDLGTNIYSNQRLGKITEINKSATVDKIDIEGTVQNITMLSSITTTGLLSSLLCTVDKQASYNEFVGKELSISGYLAPYVSILNPTAGEVVVTPSITVSISTESFDFGTSGLAQIKLDSGEWIPMASTTYTFSYVSNGSHNISVQLTGADGTPLGNEEASSSVAFYVEYVSKDPTVSILVPTSNQLITTKEVKFVFYVSNFNIGFDGSLRYSLDSTDYVPVPFVGTGEAEVILNNVADGNHLLKASLFDNNQEKIEPEASVSFETKITSGYPSIRLIYPANGVTLTSGSPSSIRVEYAAESIAIPSEARVRITIDDSIPEISSDPSVYVLTKQVSDGNHTIKLELIDANANILNSQNASTSSAFFVNSSLANSAAIYIISPIDGEPIQYVENLNFSINLEYRISQFEVGDGGNGILISIDNQTPVFTQIVELYPLPTSIGLHTATVTLANSGVPLTNSLATATSTYEVITDASRSFVQTKNSTYSLNTPKSNIPVASSRNPKTINKAFTEDEAARLTDRRWSIISNGTSEPSTGLTKIVVKGTVPNTMLGQTFKILGKTSTLYVTFDQNVLDGEFDKGIAYINPGEDNAFKNYKITRQTKNYIELNSLIDPFLANTGEVKHVEVGQKIRLIPESGQTTVWVDFTNEWGTDDLCGASIRTIGSSSGEETEQENATSAPRNSFTVVNSTERSITLSKASPATLIKGDQVELDSIIMNPVISFYGKQTSKNLDHYHDAEIIGENLSGDITSISIGISTVEIIPNPLESISHSLLASYPTIMAGAKMLFFNTSDPRKSYYKEIVSIENGVITVEKGTATDWAQTSPELGISEEWRWTIDARRYGVSVGTYYDRFITFRSVLTEDARTGQSSVTVLDASGMTTGDEVELCDSINNVQAFLILGIAGNVVELNASILKPYLMVNGSQLRVRASSFGNTHIHIIKDGEVFQTIVEEYTDSGYSYTHSHELINSIEKVKALSYDYDNEELLAVGNNSKLYTSGDDGITWWPKTVENTIMVPSNWSKSFIKIDRTDSGEVFVGTNDGFFISKEGNLVDDPLVYPGNGQLMPSSSSSSSDSSPSSISTSSSISSMTSRSSSTIRQHSTTSSDSSSSISTSSTSTEWLWRSSDSSESSIIQDE